MIPTLPSRLSTPAGSFVLDLPVETLLALFSDFYEKNEAPACSFWYDRFDRVLECGAGIGYVTTCIGQRAGHVIGVEAIPETAEVAAKNLINSEILNGQIINGALSTNSDSHTFYQRSLGYASSLLPGHDYVEKEYTVQGLEINKLIADNNINCLHLDMEGFERDIFLSTDLVPIHKVFFETHGYVYGSEGVTQIVKHLIQNGFIGVFMANPFNVSFQTNQTCVIGMARPNPAREILMKFHPVKNTYYRLKVALEGDGVRFEAEE